MVCENKGGKSEMVLRFRTKNGQDGIILDEIKSKFSDFIIQEVEGNSLEAEVLAVTAREIIKKHIVEPLSEIPLKMVHDIDAAWQEVKEPVEKLLQGRYAQCQFCGAAALSDAMHDGVQFVCPVCTEKSTWKFIPDIKHAGGGRYTLEK